MNVGVVGSGISFLLLSYDITTLLSNIRSLKKNTTFDILVWIYVSSITKSIPRAVYNNCILLYICTNP